MNNPSSKKFFSACIFCFSFVSPAFVYAQVPELRTTNTYNEQQVVYDNDSMMHTAWKPVLYNDTTIKRGTGTWFHRKFFQEHLLQIREGKFNLNADLIFDEYIGYSKREIPTGHRAGISSDSITHVPMMNTRGLQPFKRTEFLKCLRIKTTRTSNKEVKDILKSSCNCPGAFLLVN